MKKIFLASFIIFFKLQPLTFAQKDFASINIGVKHIEKLIALPDTSGNMCIYYRNLGFHFFTQLDSNGNVVRTKSFKRVSPTYGESPFIGASITKEKYIAFFGGFEMNNNYYSVYSISKYDTTDLEIHKLVLKKNKKEKVIRTYSTGDNFYVVTLKADRLYFHKFTSENEMETKSFVISKNLYSSLNKKDFSIIKSLQNHTISSVNSQKKLYVGDPQKIIYTVDNEKGKGGYGNTKIFEFDFKKDTALYYYIPSKHKLPSDHYTNSFYLNESIFRISITPSLMGLYIYNLKSGKLKKEYEYNKKARIELISDKVINKGEKMHFWFFQETEEQILEKNNIIFHALNVGNPSIAVKYHTRDTLMILVGSIVKEKSTPTNMRPTPGSTGKVLPDLYRVGTNVTWFNSFLKDSTFNIINQFKDDPIFYKIEKYKEELREKNIIITNPTVFKMNGKIYLAYIIRKDDFLKIVEIY